MDARSSSLYLEPQTVSGDRSKSLSALHRWAALLLMTASGFAGLGYQIVWTQQCALWLGHDAAAVFAVVTAFFGGLAVGAFAFGATIEKSAHPWRWYALCELVVALWALALTYLMSPVSVQLLSFTGTQPTPLWQWTVAFCGTFICLLPATVAMGATLPAMERMTRQLGEPASHVASLYAANTFGAVLGVIATAFWSIQQLGLKETTYVCAALNVLCAVASVALFSKPVTTLESRATLVRDKAYRPFITLAFTGLLGIGYEVVVVRVLSEVAEDTVYTFAMLLAVYLIGSAIGAALHQRVLRRIRTNGLLCALAIACLISLAALWAAAHVKTLALQTFGASLMAAIGAEAALAVLAFGLPTILMGALFSELSATVIASGSSFGRALAMNTLGAAAAPLIFGVLLLPSIGPKYTLLLIVFGYLLLITPRDWLRPAVWIPACATVVVGSYAPQLAFIDVPDGGRVASYEEGVMAAVSVVEDADHTAVLRINNRQQEGSSITARVDGRQAWLPLLLHTAPRSVLFLGLGTGVTASSATLDPTLQVDAVELLPEVISASAYFTDAQSSPRARMNLIAADARRYVKTADRRYDVIIADNFHPARSGSASLYTIEHFQAVKERLNEHGLFCQWLPLHQLDLDTLRSIVQSFVSVYPRGWAMLASNSLRTPVIGLVGKADDAKFDMHGLQERVVNSRLRDVRATFGMEDEFALAGSFIAGPAALRRFAGNAPANTDDLPIVAYRAPRITYVPESTPDDRLVALLHESSIRPDELLAQTDLDEATVQRLSAYWKARDHFIESGRDVRPVADVEQMLSQVREPLLTTLRMSPDFRPAYDPLLLMANALSHTNVSGARALLAELVRLQPQREEARAAIAALKNINTQHD